MTCWSRPGLCRPGCARCRRGWWCTCCCGCAVRRVGYRQVWARLTAGLDGIDVAGPGPPRWPKPVAASGQTAAGAVRAAPRPRRRCGAMAWAAGLRDRRHVDVLARHRGEPGRLQPTRRQQQRVRVSAAADADRRRLRHPHRTRRRLRHPPRGRNHLCTKAARLPTPRHAAARRPQLRRCRPDRPVAATGADLLFRSKSNRKLPAIGRCGDAPGRRGSAPRPSASSTPRSSCHSPPAPVAPSATC